VHLLLLHCLEQLVMLSPELMQAVGTAASDGAGRDHARLIICTVIAQSRDLDVRNLRERYSGLYLTGKLLQLTSEAAGRQVCAKHGREAQVLRGVLSERISKDLLHLITAVDLELDGSAKYGFSYRIHLSAPPSSAAAVNLAAAIHRALLRGNHNQQALVHSAEEATEGFVLVVPPECLKFSTADADEAHHPCAYQLRGLLADSKYGELALENEATKTAIVAALLTHLRTTDVAAVLRTLQDKRKSTVAVTLGKSIVVAVGHTSVTIEHLLRHAIDTLSVDLLYVLLEGGTDPNCVLATEPKLSACGYACRALLKAQLGGVESEALQGIIAALRDYGANLNDLGEYEDNKAVAFAIRSSAVRQVQSSYGARLERVEEKLAGFDDRFKEAEEKVSALEEGLAEVRDEYWVGVQKECVNKTFLFKMALERARLDLADSCVAMPELLKGRNVDCDELQCRKCGGSVAPNAAKFWLTWRCGWQHHRGERDMVGDDIPFGCKTMDRCCWGACMACAREAALAQKYYALFSAFCMFLQSQVRLALTGLAACSSGYVTANTSATGNSVLTHALGSVPYVGHIVRSGVVSLAGWLQMVTNRALMTRLVSNAQEDKTIEDYCVRVTQYCQHDLLRCSAGPTFADTVHGTAKQLMKDFASDLFYSRMRLRERAAETVQNIAATSLQQWLTSAHADPFIKGHWHGLAADYVLRFVSFLRDRHTSFSSVSSVGLLAAEDVIPRWFSEKELRVGEIVPAGFSYDEAAACAMVCEMCSGAQSAQLEWKARCDWGFTDVRVVTAGQNKCYVFTAGKYTMLCFRREAIFARSRSRELVKAGGRIDGGPSGGISVCGAVLDGVMCLLSSNAGTSADAVMAQLLSYLQTDPSRRLIVVGHGLGGAMAATATLQLLKEAQNATSLCSRQITAYVFGCSPWCSSGDCVRAEQAVRGRLYSVIAHNDHLANYGSFPAAEYAALKCEYELSPTGIKLLHGETTPVRQLTHTAGEMAKSLVAQLPNLLVMSISSWLGHTLRSPLVDAHNLSYYVAGLFALRATATAVDVEGSGSAQQILHAVARAEVIEGSAADVSNSWSSVLALDRIVDRPLTDPAEVSVLRQLLVDYSQGSQSTEEAADCDNASVAAETPRTVHYPDEVTKAAFDAVEEGDHERLTELLAEHPLLLDSTDSEGNTLLIVAARSNRVDALHILLVASRPLPAVTEAFFSALDGSQAIGPCSVGHSVNAVNSEQYTALMYCCQRDYARAAKLLLEHPVTNPALNSNRALQLACENNHPDLVRLLTSSPAVSVNSRTSGDGPRLVVHSLRKGYTEVAMALLERDDADISADIDTGTTVLHEAVLVDAAAEVVALLLKRASDVNWEDFDGNTALHLACSKHCIAAELLVRCAGTNVNKVNTAGKTPLEIAMSVGNTGLVGLLLLHDSIEVKPEQFRSLAFEPFALVVLHLHSCGLLARLLDKGLNPNTTCLDGKSLLHVAVLRGDHGLVQLLLSRPGIAVNCPDEYGATPLMLSAGVACNTDAMRVLLSQPDIDVNLPNMYNGTALAASICHGRGEVTSELLHRSDIIVDVVHDTWGSALFMACRKGASVATVREILKRTLLNVNSAYQVDEGDLAPLHTAVRHGHVELVRLLLDVPGILVDAPAAFVGAEEDWKLLASPLHFAVLVGNHELTRLLLDAGADVNVLDTKGNPPAFYAAACGKFDAVELLLDTGRVNTAARNLHWHTLLHLCTASPRITRLLLSDPAVDVNAQDGNGNTPLILAVDRSDGASLQLLLDEPNLDGDILNGKGYSALFQALTVNNVRAIELLLTRFPDLDVNIALPEPNGRTLLMQCAYAEPGTATALWRLAGDRIDCSAQDEDGWTALVHAIFTSNGTMVGRIMDHTGGKDEPHMYPPLSAAAFFGKTELISKLLGFDFGAQLNERGPHGDTPLLSALAYDHPEFACRLLDHPDCNVNLRRDSRPLAVHRKQLDKAELTALELAIMKRLPSVVKAIVHHPTLELWNVDEENLVECAVKFFDVDVVEALITQDTRLLMVVHRIAKTVGFSESSAAARILYSCAVEQGRSGDLLNAANSLKLSAKYAPRDYMVCKALLTLELLSAGSPQDVVTRYEGSPFMQCLLHYLQGNIEEAANLVGHALAIQYDNCFRILQAFILLKQEKLLEALEVLKCVVLSETAPVTDYFQVRKFVAGSILVELGQLRRAALAFADVKRHNTLFPEASVYAVRILFQADYLDEAERIGSRIKNQVHTLPPLEKDLLLEVLGGIEIAKHTKTSAVLLKRYDAMRDDLNAHLASLTAPWVEYSPSDIFLRWDLTAAKQRMLELSYPHASLRRPVADIVEKMDYAYKLLQPEALVPQTQTRLGKLVSRGRVVPASQRTRTAKKASTAISQDHAVFKQIVDLREILCAMSRVLQCELTREHTERQGRAEHNLGQDTGLRCDQARLLVTIERCAVYYTLYIDGFLSEYGECSQFKTGTANGAAYLCQLAAAIEARQPLLSAEKAGGPPHELVRVSMQSDGSSGGGKYLAGYALPSAEDRVLYRKFSLTAPQATEVFGSHAVFCYDKVFYKFKPYAPGIEYAVNGLNRLLLDEISLPTQLLKLEGRTGCDCGDVGYYLASAQIEGYSLHRVLADPRLLDLVERRSFSAVFVSSVFVGTGDAKPDNFIVRFTRDEETNHTKSVSLMSIDNDIAFCSGRLRVRKLPSGKNKLYSDLLNILFFFPQMDSPVDESVVRLVLDRPAAPELIVSQWLCDLYEQNQRYEALQDVGFTEHDLHALKLPIRLPKNCAVTLYRRFLLLQEILTENRSATHSTILRAFYPAISEYYQLKRSKMGADAQVATMKALYLDSCEDPEVAKLLKSKDNIKSKAGWSSASKSKEMDRERYDEAFSETVQEVTAQFLETVDCQDPRLRNETAAFTLLANNLYFLPKLRLLNVSEQQLVWMFPGASVKRAAPPADGGVSAAGAAQPATMIQEVQIVCTEENSKVLSTSAIVTNLTAKSGIKVTFDDPDEPLDAVKTIRNNITKPVKAARTELRDLQAAVQHLLLMFQEDGRTPAQTAVFLSSAISMVFNSEESDVLLLDAHDEELEGDGSLLKQFSVLLLDQVTLVPVAIALANKGVYGARSMLLHHLVRHHNVAGYEELITCIVKNCPEILLVREVDTGLLPADQVQLMPASRNTLKHRLLSALFNACRDLPAECFLPASQEDPETPRFPHILSAFADDMELLLYGASCGFGATAAEMSTGTMTLEKLCTKNNERGNTMVQAFLEDECAHKRERAALLALDAMQRRLAAGTVSSEVVDSALWTKTNPEGKSVWALALEKRCCRFLDVLCEQWRGYEKVAIYSEIGEHILCGSDPVLRVVTQCLYLVHWPVTFVDLQRYQYKVRDGETTEERAARLTQDATNDLFTSVSPKLTEMLNSRTNRAGNSLLYELVVMPQQYYEQKIRVQNISVVIEHLLKCGANPLFPKRVNKPDPMSVVQKNGRSDLYELMQRYVNL
jgi:ankyrin repeat protein